MRGLGQTRGRDGMMGGAVLGSGTYGTVHTMSDIMLHDVAPSTLVLVRSIVVPKTGAAYVTRRMVTVSMLVEEMGDNAVYKRPHGDTNEEGTTADVPTGDASITVMVTLSLAMAASAGRCGGDVIKRFSQVFPYVVLDSVTSMQMPKLAEALKPAVDSMFSYSTGTVVVIASIRIGADMEMAVFRRLSSSLTDVENSSPGAMDIHDVLSLAHAMLDTLELLACTGGSHNDVKPDNILVQQQQGGAGWTFVVTDFGLCMWNTMTISFAGTPDYMSPLVFLRKADGQRLYSSYFREGVLRDNTPWWPRSYGLRDGLCLSSEDIWDSYSHEARYMEWIQNSLYGPTDEETAITWTAARQGAPTSGLLRNKPDTFDALQTQIAEVERIQTKNDLYAVGIILARYRPLRHHGRVSGQDEDARKGSLETAAHEALFGFAMRLILGGDGSDDERRNGIWTIPAAQAELTRLHSVFATGLDGGGAMKVKMGLPRRSQPATAPPMT